MADVNSNLYSASPLDEPAVEMFDERTQKAENLRAIHKILSPQNSEPRRIQLVAIINLLFLVRIFVVWH
jgi:hypothetical protein